MSQWVAGFAEGTSASGNEYFDPSSKGWIADCLNDTEILFSNEDISASGGFDNQVDITEHCNAPPEYDPNAVEKPSVHTRRNVVLKEMSCNSRKSSHLEEEAYDLRYKIPTCICQKTCAIRVVGPTKETEGKLFCCCKYNVCRYFEWLEPISVSVNKSKSSAMKMSSGDEEIQSNQRGMDEMYAEIISICEDLTSKMKKMDGQQGLIKTLIVAIFVLLVVIFK